MMAQQMRPALTYTCDWQKPTLSTGKLMAQAYENTRWGKIRKYNMSKIGKYKRRQMLKILAGPMMNHYVVRAAGGAHDHVARGWIFSICLRLHFLCWLHIGISVLRAIHCLP